MRFLYRSVLWVAVLLAFGLPAPALSQTSEPPPLASAWLQGWPMDGHDPQRTDRSPAMGPAHPRLLFTRRHVGVGLIGPDGAMYGGKVTKGRYIPLALDQSGRQRASYHLPLSLVGVASNSTLYGIGFNVPKGHKGPASTGEAATAGFLPNGKLLWKIQPSGLLKGSEPLVAPDGTLYAPFEGSGPEFAGLDLISRDGEQRYLQKETPFWTVALASSGTIYALTFSHDTNGSYVEAVDQTGQILWQHALQVSLETWGICRCLMVGRSGVLYATDGSDLLAYTSSGGLLWRLHDKNGVLALAERLDGTLVVAGHHALHALSVDGRVLWTASIGTTGRSDGLPKLIVDAAGTTYVGTGDGKVRIFSDGGALLATLSAGRHKPFMVPSSRLAAIGRLVINGTDGTLRVYGP